MRNQFISLFPLVLLGLIQALEPLPQAIIDEMASREMRHHHFLWHNIRNLWLKLDNATQQAIRDLQWEPPRPAQWFINDTAYAIEDNGSGEDFLYMHRQMINRVKQINSMQDEPCNLTGFDSIPWPNSTEFPAFPTYNSSSSSLSATIEETKTDAYYWDKIKPKEDRFKNPRYLRNLTLGQLGSRIEFTIHNWLHTRFSQGCIAGFRNDRKSSNPIPQIDGKWDNVTYDWLVDSYSSHVNPLFWKIHIWVDDRVQDWMNANNITEIQWNCTWTGGPMSKLPDLVGIQNKAYLRKNSQTISPKKKKWSVNENGGKGHEMNGNEAGGGGPINVMEEVAKVLLKAEIEYHFYDEVMCED